MTNGKAWKIRDFPKPVGKLTKISFLLSINFDIANCWCELKAEFWRHKNERFFEICIVWSNKRSQVIGLTFKAPTFVRKWKPHIDWFIAKKGMYVCLKQPREKKSHITLQSCLVALCFDPTTLTEIAAYARDHIFKPKVRVFHYMDRPLRRQKTCYFFPAVNRLYRLQMGWFTKLLSLNGLPRRLPTICKKSWQRAINSDSRQ